MRVSTSTKFNEIRYRLSDLTSRLQDANEVVTTGKRINGIADDPVGLTQVLDLKSKLSDIDQLTKNLMVGKNWLVGGESALKSVNEIVLETKTLTSQLTNASVNAEQRKDAVEHVMGALEQIVLLGNTQVQDNYIFGGHRIDTVPLAIDNPDNPTQVNYLGDNTPFAIQSEQSTTLKVGRNGKEVFWDDYIEVNSTNNRIAFKESLDHAPDTDRYLSGILPDGEYKAADLAIAVRNAMNEASLQNGYGINYDVDYDATLKTFQIYTVGDNFPGYVATELYFDPFREPDIGNINTGITATFDIHDLLATAEEGSQAGDRINFDLHVGPASKPVSFLVDADNDVTRSNFLNALQTAVTRIDPNDLEIDSTHLNAAENELRLTSQSGELIQVRDLTRVNNASGSFGGNYVGNGFDYAAPNGDTVGFDLMLGNTIVANVLVNVDALGDTGNWNNTAIADEISRDLNKGVLMADGDSVTIPDKLGNNLTITRNGNDFDYVTDNGMGFSMVNFYDNDFSGAGNPVALSFTANAGTNLNTTGAPGTTTISAAAPNSVAPVDDPINPHLLETYGGDAKLDATVTLLNPDALSIATALPLGSAPIRFTWEGNGLWSVSNDPGYDLSGYLHGTENSLDIDLNNDTVADVTIRFDDPVPDVNDYIEFDLLKGLGIQSIGPDMALDGIDVANQPLTSDQEVNPINRIVIDATNNHIDFEEINLDGISTGALTATIPAGPGPDGEYTDMAELSLAIETALENASIAPNTDFSVSYDLETSSFTISADSPELAELRLLWNSGPNAATSAADTLGFYNTENVTGTIGFQSTLAANGWDVGDTIGMDFTIGGTTYNYSRPVGVGDTMAMILADMQAQLTVAFPTEGQFTVNGNVIDFALQNNSLKIDNITDNNGSGTGVAAQVEVTGTPESTFTSSGNSILTVGDTAELLSVDDDIITIPPAVFRITNNNNRIDFEEIDLGGVSSGKLTAIIPPGNYTSPVDLAVAIETALQSASDAIGVPNNTDYDVTYNPATGRYTIADTGAASTMAEGYLLWNSGPNASRNPASILGFDEATSASGQIGGDLLGNGWDVGDTISIDFSADGNTLNYSHTVNALDTNASLLTDLRAQLQATLGSSGAFTINGNYIDFQMDHASLSIDNITDSGAGDASFEVIGLNGSPVMPPPGPLVTVGDTVEVFAPDDDVVAATTSHTSDRAIELVTSEAAQSDRYVTHIFIDSTNNRIDFKEIIGDQDAADLDQLTATILNAEYTDMESLTQAIEDAMNGESQHFGNNITYEVSWDPETKKISIQENGSTLDALHLLWASGQNAAQSAGPTLGFDTQDDHYTPIESTESVEWGVFNTLIALKGYLKDNNVDGIERSMSRLSTHYDHFESTIADTGIKYNRIEIRNQINLELNVSLTERRANLEEADYVEAIMNLQEIELAYKAALNSSAQIMQLSLADYL